MRKGSSHHSAAISGTVNNAAEITDQRRSGKIVNRKAAVSRSITMTSTKFAVICAISCLRRDSRTSTTISVSDNAADKAGRRNSASQKKFRIPQDSRKPRQAATSTSVASMSPSAARWGLATASHCQRLTAPRPVAAAVALGGELEEIVILTRCLGLTRRAPAQPHALAKPSSGDQQTHGKAQGPHTVS